MIGREDDAAALRDLPGAQSPEAKERAQERVADDVEDGEERAVEPRPEASSRDLGPGRAGGVAEQPARDYRILFLASAASGEPG